MKGSIQKKLIAAISEVGVDGVTRAYLTEVTKSRKASVYQALGVLVARGIVEEAGEHYPPRFRPVPFDPIPREDLHFRQRQIVRLLSRTDRSVRTDSVVFRLGICEKTDAVEWLKDLQEKRLVLSTGAGFKYWRATVWGREWASDNRP